jgi:hypothetical protein
MALIYLAMIVVNLLIIISTLPDQLWLGSCGLFGYSWFLVCLMYNFRKVVND